MQTPPNRLKAEVNRVDRMLALRKYRLEEKLQVASQLEGLWSDVVAKFNKLDTTTPGYPAYEL